MPKIYGYSPLVPNLFSKLVTGVKSLSRKNKSKLIDKLQHMGKDHIQNAEYEKALKCFEKALKIDLKNICQKHACLYNSLGDVYYKIHNYDGALIHFKEAAKLDSQSALFYSNCGAAYREIGNDKRALEFYRQAIKLDPENTSIHNNLGILYAKMGQYKKSLEHSKKAIKFDPKNAFFHNNLGLTYLNIGKYE